MHQPVGLADRIVVLDALRGFLLLFILIANLPALTGFWFMSDEQRELLQMSRIDENLLFLLDTLVYGKFYSLFSLLFGIGFAVILSRISAKGIGVGLYRRRLAVLAMFGFVHMLIWPGDILLPYALCGLLLVFFRGANDSTLLKAAALFIALPIAYYGLAWVTEGRYDPAFYLFEFLKNVAGPSFGPEGGPFNAYQTGTLAEVFRANIIGFGYRWVDLIFEGRLLKVIGVFLLGLWLGRRLLAGGVLNDTRLLKRTLLVGLVVGIPCNIGLAILYAAEVSFPMSWLGLLQYTLYALGVVPLALAYAAGFALLWRQEKGRRVLGLFGPMGRMALTNYIMQTLIAITLFYGIGFGMLGTAAPSDWLLIALGIVAFQMVFSAAWLRYFSFGPLEWVWRVATYGRRNVSRDSGSRVARM